MYVFIYKSEKKIPLCTLDKVLVNVVYTLRSACDAFPMSTHNIFSWRNKKNNWTFSY